MHEPRLTSSPGSTPPVNLSPTPESLRGLGVQADLLSPEEQDALDRDGFLAVPGALTGSQVEALRRRCQELLAVEGDRAGIEVHQEAGTDRLANLVDKGTEFEWLISHPKVLAAVAHVLGGDVKLSSLNGRFAKPGLGQQALHADWHSSVAADDYQVCNSIWLLDDFTLDNGATRVVAGSHRDGRRPHEAMADPAAAHPQEQLLLGQSGTVVVFNSHVWHGGTLNRTAQPRRALHAYFTRRGQPQQLDQRANLRAETVRRLSPALRDLLDVT